MPTISDYIIVTDQGTKLKSSGTRQATFPFFVPLNIDASKRAVAIWQFEAEGLETEARPQGLTWDIFVNNKRLTGFIHHLNRFNALQEVLPGSVLEAGEHNHATVRITDGKGVIKFSAFVIHIQVNDGSTAGDPTTGGDG
jgi:hypothetical protein